MQIFRWFRCSIYCPEFGSICLQQQLSWWYCKEKLPGLFPWFFLVSGFQTRVPKFCFQKSVSDDSALHFVCIFLLVCWNRTLACLQHFLMLWTDRIQFGLSCVILCTWWLALTIIRVLLFAECPLFQPSDFPALSTDLGSRESGEQLPERSLRRPQTTKSKPTPCHWAQRYTHGHKHMLIWRGF